jgi:hypothetical protein
MQLLTKNMHNVRHNRLNGIAGPSIHIHGFPDLIGENARYIYIKLETFATVLFGIDLS